MTSPPVPWPDSASYVCGSFITPCHSCGHAYERARAEAAMERLRLAVEALVYTREHIGVQDDACWIHSRVFNALHAIGPLPPLPGRE